MNKKLILIIMAVAVAGGGIFFLVSKNKNEPIKEVVSKEIYSPIIGTGTLEAKTVIVIAPKTTAKIVSTYSDEGKNVKKGEILAKMETSEIEASINENIALIEKNKAQSESQKAHINDLQAKYDLAKINLDRYEKLLADGFVAKAEYDSILALEKSAKAQLQSANKTLLFFNKETQKSEASKQVQIAKLNDLKLVSPIDGVVLSKNAEEGSTIVAGSPIFRLADPKTIWVKVFVDESRIGEISLGTKAQVSLRTSPNVIFDAKVTRIGVESDRITEERIVYLELNKQLPNFNLGDQAEAKFYHD